MNTTYHFGTTLSVSYEEALSDVKAVLQTEGFGVLTDIDLQRTLQEKVGARLEPYHVLGICNPSLAQRALARDPSIGLLLPCHVVVRAEGEACRIEVADPEAMPGLAGNDHLRDIAQEVRERLLRAINRLSSRQTA